MITTGTFTRLVSKNKDCFSIGILYSIKQSIDEPNVLSMHSKYVPSLGQVGFASVLYSIKQSINEPNVLSMHSKYVPSLWQMGFVLSLSVSIWFS